MITWYRSRPVLAAALGLVVVVVAILIALTFMPFSLNDSPAPNPAQSYEDSLGRISSILSTERSLGVRPECEPRLLTHGAKAASVIVLLHGFTACPEQFAEVGQEYFDRGYNVYIPRLPRHGLKTRLGEPLEGLTAEELAASGQQSADIAQGLGERVVIAGLSGGGVIATYLSQARSDVDVVAPVSPFLGVEFIPASLNRAAANLLLLLPDSWQWWDSASKENNPTSAPYSYARYSMHSLMEVMRLGFAAEAAARRDPIGARQTIFITNAADDSVNNAVVAEFKQVWRENGARSLQEYEFPRELGLPHDLITPTRPGSRVDVVYPKLLEMVQ